MCFQDPGCISATADRPLTLLDISASQGIVMLAWCSDGRPTTQRPSTSLENLGATAHRWTPAGDRATNEMKVKGERQSIDDEDCFQRFLG